jgi:hypothetical protein
MLLLSLLPGRGVVGVINAVVTLATIPSGAMSTLRRDDLRGLSSSGLVAANFERPSLTVISPGPSTPAWGLFLYTGDCIIKQTEKGISTRYNQEIQNASNMNYIPVQLSGEKAQEQREVPARPPGG